MLFSKKVSNFLNSSYIVSLLLSKKYFFIENSLLQFNILNFQKNDNLEKIKFKIKKSSFLSIFKSFKNNFSIKFPLNLYLLNNDDTFKNFFIHISNRSTLIVFFYKNNLFENVVLSKFYFETITNFLKFDLLCSYNVKFLNFRTFYR
jgi:hypothetical protein